MTSSATRRTPHCSLLIWIEASMLAVFSSPIPCMDAVPDSLSVPRFVMSRTSPFGGPGWSSATMINCEKNPGTKLGDLFRQAENSLSSAMPTRSGPDRRRSFGRKKGQGIVSRLTTSWKFPRTGGKDDLEWIKAKAASGYCQTDRLPIASPSILQGTFRS